MTNSTSINAVVGSCVIDNLVTTTPAGQNWFIGLSVTIGDPPASNNPGFAIGLVNASTGADNISTQGTALNNSSGDWRFDNVTISSAAAVPRTECGRVDAGWPCSRWMRLRSGRC